MYDEHTYENAKATEIRLARIRIEEIKQSIREYAHDYEVCEGLYCEWTLLVTLLREHGLSVSDIASRIQDRPRPNMK